MGLVAGQISLPTTQAFSNAEIHFTAMKNSDGVVLGVSASFKTDAEGNYSQVIVPGYYRVTISYWPEHGPMVRRWFLGMATVTEQSSTLNELLGVEHG